jgi:hypothetical protein
MALADANGPLVQVSNSPSRHFLYWIMQISHVIFRRQIAANIAKLPDLLRR